jgi:UDP-N-acetylglucosamine--N-acetylmuramyl-(pentapeptide) pyrophosphoryl-undecaprenol N-acetylglucosamine transferase
MRVVFTGGGTGGHLYPALALARHIRKEDPSSEMIFLGTEKGLESKILPPAGFGLKVLTIKTPVRRLSRAMFRTFFIMAGGTLEAAKFLRWFSPDVVVGTGGYVSVPAVLAAMLLRIPVVLHEQNVIPGLANKKLAPWVALTCLSFPDSCHHFPPRARLTVTGNPRASEVVGAAAGEDEYRLLGLMPGRKTLLITGGSQGASKLNKLTLKALQLLEGRKDLQVLYITGQRYFEDMQSEARSLAPEPFIKMVPYLENMPLALSVADAVISRAGATTLAEINARGIPAILVPSPNVTNDHQWANAEVLEKKGAAFAFREEELTSEKLRETLCHLLDNPEKLTAMHKASLDLGYPRAAAAMYDALLKIRSNPR